MDYKKLVVLSAIIIVIAFITAESGPGPHKAKYKTEEVVTGLDTPWGIDFLPENRIIFTERPGRLNIQEGNTTSTVKLPSSMETGEGGLLGIEVDPQHVKNQHIYLYYTTEEDNRVARFRLEDDKIKEKKILLEGIPKSSYHNGGRIEFGPQEKLFITTGDATKPRLSQDTASLAGKILRINKDGSIPEDNPFGNAVWSYGHRNPQGLAWNKEGKLYSTEHGPSRHDEINIIRKGENYGWPNKCKSQEEGTVEPIRCYTEFTLAPSGTEHYNGSLYIAGLRGSQLRKVEIESGNITSESRSLEGYGRLRTVEENNGSLYVATSNRDGRGLAGRDDDKIIKISPPR